MSLLAQQPYKKVFLEIVGGLAFAYVSGLVIAKCVTKYLDPMKKDKDDARKESNTILHRLGKLILTDYERVIIREIVHSSSIDVTFQDIGGLDDIIAELTETVINPLIYPEMFSSKMKSKLLTPPKGVLLYGPPGCGKTLLAKAIAKESGAIIINITVSALQEKWYGESQKLVSALFSVAEKLSQKTGVIIFIDEIDSFLRVRQSGDHEVTSQMKALFMTLWDGLLTADNGRIIIIGATNRKQDIDKAILRRMPKHFKVSLPNLKQRHRILEITLSEFLLENNFLLKLAEMTSNYSGSDLKEMCRNAAMNAMRDVVRAAQVGNNNSQDFDLRPLELRDFQITDSIKTEAVRQKAHSMLFSSFGQQSDSDQDLFT